MRTCEKHGNSVVVIYQAESYGSSACPYCDAESELEDIRAKVTELEEERDGLKEDIPELKTQIAELQGTITSLELGDDE